MTPEELDAWWENERKNIKPHDPPLTGFIDMGNARAKMDKRMVAPWLTG